MEEDRIKRRGPKKTISIALYPELIRLLDKACDRVRRSRSSYIGLVLEEHFKKLEEEQKPSRPLIRA